MESGEDEACTGKQDGGSAEENRGKSKKPKSPFVQKIIEVLQDRCEETGKDLEAPPIVRKVLNIIFLLLGVSLLLGVLVAVVVTVIQEVDSRSQNAEASARYHHDRAKVVQQTFRQAHYISWPPRILPTKPRDSWI